MAERDMGRLPRLFYNRELTKRDFNRYFRRYKAFLDDPSAVPEEIDDTIAKEFPAMVKPPFWWIVNPAGRFLERIMMDHYGKRIRDYQEKKGSSWN